MARSSAPAGVSRRWVLPAVAALVCADQAIKAMVVRQLPLGDSVTVIPGVLSLTHVQNTGVAFGLFAGLPPVVTTLVALTLLAMLFYNKGRWLATRAVGAGIALMAGGASGNVLDRIRRGYVVDYLDLHVWPVFNLADVSIVVGAGVLIIALLGDKGQNRSRR